MLEQTGSAEAMDRDLYVVNMLVNKLPALWLDKWLEFAEAQLEEVIPGQNEWGIIRDWLRKCYKVAIVAWRH